MATLEERKQAARERSKKRHRAQREGMWAETVKRALTIARKVRAELAERGMTADVYESLYVAQNGRCAICGTPDEPTARLHVDHCHADGKVRGLLCNSCNAGLGFFQDDPEILLKAVGYLRAPAHPWLYRPNYRRIRR